MLGLRTIRVVVSIAAAMLAAASAEADTLDKLLVSKTLHLGYRPNSVPFSYLDKTDAPAGYAVTICKHMAEVLSREVKIPLQIAWIPVGPNERTSALADGLVDIDCADSTVTNQSQKEVSFTIPMFVAGTRLLIAGKSETADLGRFHKKTIVTTSQSGNEAMLRHVLGQTGVDAQVLVTRNHKTALEALRKGQAQALFADDATLFAIRLATGDKQDLSVLPKVYSMRVKALAFRTDEPRLKAILSREMRILIANGTLAKWHEKFFNSDLAGFGINFKTPVSYLLRETWRFPTDVYVDHVYGHLPD